MQAGSTLLSKILFVFFLALVLSPPSSMCSAQSATDPVKAYIIGGSPAPNLTSSRVALILNSQFECSGILVGPKHVLTAGHCVAPSPAELPNPPPVSDYSVTVGGATYSVAQMFYNSNYQPGGPVDYDNSRFDLGMLVLHTEVTGASPMPIASDLSIEAGFVGYIAGYGANETSGISNAAPSQRGKIARVVLTAVPDGLLESNYSTSQGASCAGDSGGPAYWTFGNYAAVVGTASFGINALDGFNDCLLIDIGTFDYVSLQSPYSEAFLAQFPEILRLSGNHVVINVNAGRLVVSLTAAARQKNLAALRKKVKQFTNTLSPLRAIADNDRLPLIKTALLSLRNAGRTNSLRTAVKEVKKALQTVRSIANLGV